jgi:hypothetical protein
MKDLYHNLYLDILVRNGSYGKRNGKLYYYTPRDPDGRSSVYNGHWFCKYFIVGERNAQ